MNSFDTGEARAFDRELRWRQLRRTLGEHLGLLAVLAAMVGLFGTLSDHFFERSTFATIANQIPDLTMIAVGMTFVLILGGIDLSVGSVVALTTVVSALLLNRGARPLLAALADDDPFASARERLAARALPDALLRSRRPWSAPASAKSAACP